jgi:hypothetical protein
MAFGLGHTMLDWGAGLIDGPLGAAAATPRRPRWW